MKEIFSESSEISCMRVMSLVALVFGFAIAVAGLYLGKDLSQIAILAGVFVGPAFAGKATQKAFEAKKDS